MNVGVIAEEWYGCRPAELASNCDLKKYTGKLLCLRIQFQTVIKHDRDINNTMLDLERLRNFAFDIEVLVCAQANKSQTI